MIISILTTLFLAGFVNSVSSSCGRPTVAPYVDITLTDKPPIEVAKATGQKAFTIAFVLGGSNGCTPMWGGVVDIADDSIIGKLRDLQDYGCELVIATGGAAGPYLENACTDVNSLASAYEKILDVTKTMHLDIDIEATVDMDRVTMALKKVQTDRPNVTVSFTLMVQADDYGITPVLGVQLLQKAVKNGLRVDIVNPMTMEFPSSKPSWGDAVISASEATVQQMKTIWPDKSETQLYSMLGVTPMIGRNFNGKIFQPSYAQQLVNWAKKNQIGSLAFWSVGRDNGNCAGGAVSPLCSSIAQDQYEFTKIFSTYFSCINPINNEIPNDGTVMPTTTNPPITNPPTRNPPTTMTPSCRGKTNSAFNEWCEENCSAGFCPPEYCIC